MFAGGNTRRDEEDYWRRHSRHCLPKRVRQNQEPRLCIRGVWKSPSSGYGQAEADSWTNPAVEPSDCSGLGRTWAGSGWWHHVQGMYQFLHFYLALKGLSLNSGSTEKRTMRCKQGKQGKVSTGCLGSLTAHSSGSGRSTPFPWSWAIIIIMFIY